MDTTPRAPPLLSHWLLVRKRTLTRNLTTVPRVSQSGGASAEGARGAGRLTKGSQKTEHTWICPGVELLHHEEKDTNPDPTRRFLDLMQERIQAVEAGKSKEGQHLVEAILRVEPLRRVPRQELTSAFCPSVMGWMTFARC
ncbi:uncharacterized protein LOC144578705 [Callithrix jacchus]